MSPIACSLAVMLVLEAAPVGPSECPVTDNRCKAERFVQRAATAASSALRAKYLEAAHGSFLASYDTSRDVRDLCAARRTFDQTLAALGTATATKRLEPLEQELEKREQARRPRCAPGPGKPPNAPVVARARPLTEASPASPPTGLPPTPPSKSEVPSPTPPSSERDLMPVSTAYRTPTTRGISQASPAIALADAQGPTAPTRLNPGRADRRLVIAGSVTLALGLSLVGVTAYAGSQRIEARRASRELLADAQGHATAEQTAQDLALRDTYRTMGHLALGTSLAGGAAVLVGTTLAVIGGRRLARVARRIALGPRPGGLEIHARF
ncbi:MAG: hypothetical protein JNK56_33880 [Myxococcales bacterium]|nr:hypothetical protein [Myxococcales bacterium]